MMAVRTIPLTRGYVAMVDEGDYARVAAHKWCVMVRRTKTRTTVYAKRAQRLNGRKSWVYMHHFILGRVTRTDHRDGDGLNNTRFNLRPCSQSENLANKRKGSGTSRFKGVSWNKMTRKWAAAIWKDNVEHKLGHFPAEADAATAYNFKAYELYGEFARMNTPGMEALCSA